MILLSSLEVSLFSDDCFASAIECFLLKLMYNTLFLLGYSGTVIREEVGLSLDKAEKEVLGHAAKVVLTKDTTTIVGDGSTQEAVNKRVAQIRNLVEVHIYIVTFFNCLLCCYSLVMDVWICRQQIRTMKKRSLMKELQNFQVVLLSFR